MKKSVLACMMAIGSVAMASAQQPPQIWTAVPPQPLATEMRRAEIERMQTYRLIRPVETRITKGAPYSAEATTEFTQVLSDGNRINRKSVTRVFRDSDGRTRREQIGAGGTGEATSVSIVDPVGGASFVLDPEKRTARKGATAVAMTVPPAGVAGARGSGGGGRGGRATAPSSAPVLPSGHDGAEARRREAETAARVELSATSREASGQWRIAQERAASGEGQTTTESLGQQIIEGVPAEGKRTTTVIPAGGVGNAQPIKIVSEEWFSPDLQVLVMTRHSDPRSGETSYRLTNLIRAEQDRSLFEVPSDYTIQEPSRR